LPRFGGGMRNPHFFSSSTGCHLSGNHYNDDEAVKTAVNSWLSEEAASYYEEVTKKLFERYDQC